MFELPEWSPLYDESAVQAAAAAAKEEAAAAAAVEELQSALSAFISSLPAPIPHAQQFPISDASLVQQLDEAVAAGPTAKQVVAITKKLEAIKISWPLVPQQQQQPKKQGTPGSKVTPRAKTSAADGSDNKAAASDTTETRVCIQPIDSQQRPAQPSSPSTAVFSSHQSAEPSASSFGLLSFASSSPELVDATGTVMRVTRSGTIGRLPRFSSNTTADTATARRLRAVVSPEAAETSRASAAAVDAAAAAAATTHIPSSNRARAPVLPLPPPRVQTAATAPAFATISSHADAAVLNNEQRRKRRARRTTAPAAEGGASRSAVSSKQQRDPYHGGWLD